VNRRVADWLVGVLVAVVLLGGLYSTWQAAQRYRAVDSMMGGAMGGVHGTNPLWYALGTVVAAAVVGGVYVAVRDEFTDAPGRVEPSARSDSPPPEGSRLDGGSTSESERASADAVEHAPPARSRVLDLLPEDERRVLEPVLASPGITQIALRDRSSFSKSKVSQTVSALEKRGLLYRERQGRTYRVYPDESLVDADSE